MSPGETDKELVHIVSAEFGRQSKALSRSNNMLLKFFTGLLATAMGGMAWNQTSQNSAIEHQRADLEILKAREPSEDDRRQQVQDDLKVHEEIARLVVITDGILTRLDRSKLP